MTTILSPTPKPKPETKCLSAIRHNLIRLSEPIREILSRAQYNPPQNTTFSLKSTLETLIPVRDSPSLTENGDEQIRREIRDFGLCCIALASAEGENGDLFSWIPRKLSIMAKSALRDISEAIFSGSDENSWCNLGAEFNSATSECKFVVELMPDVLPLLKGVIKDSSIDSLDDEVSAASARVPVASAIVAAYQFRWLVTQVNYPYLEKLCSLVIPCGLTALDHWSPAVKGQGMVVFIHLAKNVNAAELGWYEDVILDACCRNIASSDELWHHVVEMSVLLVTCTQRRNPRSSWFERMLNEMFGHLERQPRDKEHRIAWLELIEPIFSAMGLVLLAHFRRIFPLFFQWMHADDDKTVLLVLERIHLIIKLTWIRNTPYIERLVNELTVTYKESATRKDREAIRAHIVQILVLLQQCKGLKFEAAWDKHRDDPNFAALTSSLVGMNIVSIVQ
ncbi:ARM repeat superfamily protein isoform X2 [Tasmannia lanceolata]|uniref:ARM repeat superfamily protein isoform X2 n=1 Tax=Tasmannia lanceolata TaxID=3420 RepID=UPI004063A558